VWNVFEASEMPAQCGFAVCEPDACECAVSTAVPGWLPSTSTASSSGGHEPSFGSSQNAACMPGVPGILADISK